MSYIQFINHASIIISNGKKSLLSDPWYSGNVFNNGWNLLVENKEEDINKILDKVNYIWISHEHPDHFSPPFFSMYLEKILEREITVIFQYTKDKRVINFLNSKNIPVVELRNNKYFEIDDNFKVRIQKVDFYDSALIVDINNKKIINLNDCPFETENELKKFSKIYGPADILLSQFGYAAWKGGKDNLSWRKIAAKEKLINLEKQAFYLNCSKLIPFASFIYFSNTENQYLNQDNNNPQIVEKFFKNKDLDTIFFQPLEVQDIEKLKQSSETLKFWNDKFLGIKRLEYHKYNKTFTINEIKEEYNKYLNIIYKNNTRLIIRFLNFFSFLNIFSDLKIFLIDLDKIIKLSIVDGINVLDNKNEYDLKIHSESLIFIFKNQFGFDTLTVNANFEVGEKSFGKITKHLAIGSLNSMGFGLKFSLLLNPNIYLLLLKKLFRVGKRLEVD